jgi:hypothetical protein
MPVTLRRRPLATLVTLAIGLLASGCSDAITRQGEAGAVGSSGTAPAAIAVSTAASLVTVENRAGLPLLDVTVTVKATNGLSFSKPIGRLEDSARREISLGEMRSGDGTTFNTMFHRPREIAVTATDLVGKKYDVTVPWK